MIGFLSAVWGDTPSNVEASVYSLVRGETEGLEGKELVDKCAEILRDFVSGGITAMQQYGIAGDALSTEEWISRGTRHMSPNQS